MWKLFALSSSLFLECYCEIAEDWSEHNCICSFISLSFCCENCCGIIGKLLSVILTWNWRIAESGTNWGSCVAAGTWQILRLLDTINRFPSETNILLQTLLSFIDKYGAQFFCIDQLFILRFQCRLYNAIHLLNSRPIGMFYTEYDLWLITKFQGIYIDADIEDPL